MDVNAANKTAANMGMSPTTVTAVVSQYLELAPTQADYKCPYCDKEYKTASGAKNHLRTHKKKGGK